MSSPIVTLTEVNIYVNQDIPLTTQFIDRNGNAVDLTGKTVRYDYWLPTNGSDIPDSSVPGTIVDAVSGSATGLIPATENTTSGRYLRVQGVVVDSGVDLPEVTTRFEIFARGR